jgi:hypothetical protein
MSKRWTSIGGPIFAVVMAPLLVDCAAAKGLPGGGDACPVKLDDPQAIMSGSLGIDAKLEGKVKASLAAGANLQKLAVDIEADVAGACAGLAKDLGATDDEIAPKSDGPGEKAKAACEAAATYIGKVKAEVGGKITVKAQEPKCRASIDAMANCAATCDANIEPGSAEVKCEGGEVSGTCEGECSGSCAVEAGAECDGSCGASCTGSCSAGFSGKCGGNCDGKCDGKNTKGKCEGNCDGKCDAQAEGSCSGSCKGSCSGRCEMQGKADCKGSCSGGCSVELKAPECSGEVKPPEMSAECQANCDAELNANLECDPPSLTVTIEGAANAEAAQKLQAAFRTHLPALFKVTLGMKGRLESVMANVEASVKGLDAVVKADASTMMKIGGCVAGAIKAQADAAVSINVSVEASASASGSASAG